MEAKNEKSSYSYTSDGSIKGELARWKRPSQRVLMLTALALVCAGTCDTLMAKLMNRQKVSLGPGLDPRYFEGPLWQTLISYLLESCMIFIYLYDKHKAKEKGFSYNSPYVHLHTTENSFRKKHCPVYLWAIPSFLDFLTSVGVNYAIVFIHASTLQLLRNFNVVATTILSLLWVKVALRVHQWIGVLLVTIGLIVIAIQEFVTPDESTNYKSLAWIGILMALVGTLANAFQVVFEERLYRDYHVSPFEAMGYFGIFGLVFSLIMYAIVEPIPIWKSDKLSTTFYVLSTRTLEGNLIVLATCVLICSICTFNLTGMIVTKLGSCLMRMIVISFRTLTIWIIELILGWNTFGIFTLVGLIITTLGVLIYHYNYLIVPEAWSCDLALRKPIMLWKALKNPDEVERETVESCKKLEMTSTHKSRVLDEI